jgi:DNA-binding transcriptional MocR family regulator
VVRLGTFSKTLGPGLRLGWIIADPAQVSRLVSHGLLVSGGCLNHTTSMAVTVVLRDGDYDRHLAELRDQVRLRRDALVDALRDRLDDRVEFTPPAGGFFLWLRFPAGVVESDLVAAAVAANVMVAGGSRFGRTPTPHVRLAYSFNRPDGLVAAAERLATAWNTMP